MRVFGRRAGNALQRRNVKPFLEAGRGRSRVVGGAAGEQRDLARLPLAGGAAAAGAAARDAAREVPQQRKRAL